MNTNGSTSGYYPPAGTQIEHLHSGNTVATPGPVEVSVKTAESVNDDYARSIRRRTRSGCWTCRRRKVKCDEERPICRRCQIAKTDCAGYPIPAEPKKKRTKGVAANNRQLTPKSANSSSASSASTMSTSTPFGGTPSIEAEPVPPSPPPAQPVRKAARLGGLDPYHWPVSQSRPINAMLQRKSGSTGSLSSMSTVASAPPSSTGHLSASVSSTIQTPPIDRSNSSSSTFEQESTTHRYDPVDPRYSQTPSQLGFSSTLGPQMQAQIQPSAYPVTGGTIAPLGFDSAFPMQSSFASGPQHTFAGQGSASTVGAGAPVQGGTPIDFDSLFGYTSQGLEQTQNTSVPQQSMLGAPFPVDYWEDADFVDRIMTGFRDMQGQEQTNASSSDAMSNRTADTSLQRDAAQLARPQPARQASQLPSLSSGHSSMASSTAQTPPLQPPSLVPSNKDSLYAQSQPAAASASHSPQSANSDLRNNNQAISYASSVQQASSPASTPGPVNTTMADFAPQPAIDPILQATSTSELHKTAANRNKNAPSLQELEMGPPPNLHGNQKEWSIPPKMDETLRGMTNARHVELLKHYFINLVGLFSPIDHPKNPFRTFVADHATESLSLLHAVLAVSAINQQPLSVEARAESLLYFEAAVDLYVRSLQQQDDISLFTLLFLSLYYAFDSGTAQPQHFSRRAQSIINERMDLLGTDVLQASSDFRYLVRFHVWYEVLANISRRAGDLRDMACGQYTLSYLLSVIERWDVQEEKSAGLSGVNPDYVMNGCVGVPTFFISLLNDISRLKEEQHAILQIPSSGLDETSTNIRKAVISKHHRKIRDLECKIQFARPGRLLLPPIVANELHIHRAVSVRFFDLFRLATSIHLLTELQDTPVNDSAIQLRTTEMVNLLGNIEQNSNYNTSGIWAFFIAGAAASSHMDRIALHRRLDSTWNSPCGNVWSLRSVLDEVWQRNAEALENNEPCQNWKEIAHQRGWQLLLM